MLNTLLDIFLRPSTVADYVTVAFVLVMIVLFAYALLRLTVPIRSSARAFRKATQQLSSSSWSEESSPFPRRFRLLKRLWQTFLSRYGNERVEVGGELVGVVRPEEVFSPTQVLAGYNRRLALAFGGIFAGLGILGTFAGLFIGLFGIRTGTDDQLLSGVRQLLGGMSTAFITSIAGISLSLLWIFVDRFSYNTLRRRAERFFEAVGSRFPVRSVESVLIQSLALEVEQKAILQNLGTDLASAFERAINEGLAAQLSPALDSIAETLKPQ